MLIKGLRRQEDDAVMVVASVDVEMKPIIFENI